MTILECGHEPTPDAGCGTGYSLDPKTGRRSCYPCSDNLEREAMLHSEGRFFAYLSSDGHAVTTWTGGLLGTVERLTRNTRQTFVRVVGSDGWMWSGIGPADSGSYVSLRRLKVRAS